MNNLSKHILDLVNSKAAFSDIHIEQNAEVMWRRPGGWEATGYGEALMEDIVPFIASMDRDWKKHLDNGIAISKAFNLTSVRLRCSAFSIQSRSRHAISIRRIPIEVPSVETLGLPPAALKFVRAPKGLLLVSGATGSGKTTTLASFVKKIAEFRAAHIVTIEEPIEYILERRNASIITQREIGTDVKSFATGLKESLRQRPDVILIGEILDRDTAETVLRAAESGHFVMATIHAQNAIGALRKMVDFFPDEVATKASALANTIVGVMSQALVASTDGESFQLAVEMITNADSAVTTAIADPAKYKQLEEIQRRGQFNCLYMNTVLARMHQSGKATREAVLAAAYNQEELRLMLDQKRDVV